MDEVEGERTCAGGAACARRRQQRWRLMDGVVMPVDGYVEGCGAGIDKSQVGGGDVLREEEKGF